MYNNLDILVPYSWRHPDLQDGATMHELACRCGGLDVNSRYAYLLLAHHFRHTCLLGAVGGKTVGFVSGYWIPGSRSELFVWQIGVDPAWRIRGVAGSMLRELIRPYTHLLTATAR